LEEQRFQEVVDDNVDAADSLAILLGLEGFTVDVAYTGKKLCLP